MKRLLFAAIIATSLAFAPTAYAASCTPDEAGEIASGIQSAMPDRVVADYTFAVMKEVKMHATSCEVFYALVGPTGQEEFVAGVIAIKSERLGMMPVGALVFDGAGKIVYIRVGSWSWTRPKGTSI